jgi:hypothetical protein
MNNGPKNVTPLKPFKKKIDGWVEMEYDASTEVGIFTWFRVKGGMSGRSNREDWVCDVPYGTVSVHDYQLVGNQLLAYRQFNSFEKAAKSELKKCLEYIKHKKQKLLDEIVASETAIKLIERALK